MMVLLAVVATASALTVFENPSKKSHFSTLELILSSYVKTSLILVLIIEAEV